MLKGNGEMKRSIMKVVSIGLAFITSFLLTVTVYAAVASEGDSTNGNYLGKYINDSTIGYIWAKEGNLTIFTYKDNNKNCYVTGTVSSYIIKPGTLGFRADIPIAARVTSTGDTVMSNPRLDNYTASGDVTIDYGFFGTIKHVNITSREGSLKYVK